MTEREQRGLAIAALCKIEKKYLPPPLWDGTSQLPPK